MVARRSARAGRVRALNQIRHLSFTGPERLRERLKGLTPQAVAVEVASLRPRRGGDEVTYATKVALRSLGRRVLALEEETAALDELLGELVGGVADDLLCLYGVGVDSAAALLVAAGDNPERLRSESSCDHLCGAAPIEASSGKITRHRLDRRGDRQANAALWRIVMVRMRHEPRTRAYVERRTAEGRSKPEIMRALKRYVAREVYYLPRL